VRKRKHLLNKQVRSRLIN